MKTQKVSIGLVIVDETLYPRHKISEGNVAQLKDAILAGAKLPPVVLDTDTKKVVDGWHRIEAMRRLYGEETEIEAELRHYDSQREMFIDAVSINAAQGYKLTTWDRVRSIMRLIEMGADEQTIRKTLSITEDKMRKLMERIATGPKGEKVPLKGSMKDFGGKKITSEQQTYTQGPAPGINILSMLSQVIRALEAHVVNFDDPRIVERFERILALYEEVRHDAA